MKLKTSSLALLLMAAFTHVCSRNALADGFGITGRATDDPIMILWEGENWAPGSARPVIAGLGDSVAAGYGLGIDDNSLSYPSLVLEEWGRRHGFTGLNVAVSAATSSDILVQGGQLDRVLELKPDIVTLTVGGDDIHFANCLTQLLTKPRGASNPCLGPQLSIRLHRLHKNLTRIFSQLHGANPNVQIYITTYYNPLPARPGSKENQSPTSCEVFRAEALLEGASKNLEQRSIRLQDSTYAVAAHVVERLNGTILKAASQHSFVHAVPIHHLFSPAGAPHHDFCEPEDFGWVFGPAFVTSPPVSTILPSGALPEFCPDPRTPQDTTPIVELDSLLQIFSNCTPHPTEVGQQQIADAVCAEFPSTLDCQD
jgi:lysophospholipase L1-like esterase